jgi:hypothetical protein
MRLRQREMPKHSGATSLELSGPGIHLRQPYLLSLRMTVPPSSRRSGNGFLTYTMRRG